MPSSEWESGPRVRAVSASAIGCQPSSYAGAVKDLVASSSIARALLVASFVVMLLSEVSIRLRNVTPRTSTQMDRGSVIAVVTGIATGALAAGWCSAKVPALDIPGGWFALVGALAFIWSGIILRQWAVWVLGRFFTVVVRVDEEQQTVDRGPFRWVRHPSYTGLLLTFVGIGLAIGNWLSLTALVILPTIGLLIRIRVEERALLSSLGGYRDYAQGRARLIPGVW